MLAAEPTSATAAPGRWFHVLGGGGGGPGGGAKQQTK